MSAPISSMGSVSSRQSIMQNSEQRVNNVALSKQEENSRQMQEQVTQIHGSKSSVLKNATISMEIKPYDSQRAEQMMSQEKMLPSHAFSDEESKVTNSNSLAGGAVETGSIIESIDTKSTSKGVLGSILDKNI